MALANTSHSYGSIARSLHWLTALVILTAFPLGLIANAWPWETSAQLGVKATLFSLHKTLGLMAFSVALLRILWAFAQPRPAPIHPDRRAETMAADIVHWTLYTAMLAVPLSGWVHHAATTGFAPIWWPFGQGLPFVPLDEGVAKLAGAAHWVFTKLLALAIVLHVAGALKHHLMDRDGTLVRMWRGAPAGSGAGAGHGPMPALAALALHALAIALAVALVPAQAERPALAQPSAAGNWQVQEGQLALEVRQMGAGVTGGFAQWTAAIVFDEVARDGRHGEVEVTVAIDSLTLGSVTGQALGPDFFAAELHPTAVFVADILADGEGFVADGTLTLRGVAVPVRLPFTLRIDGDRAEMTGTTSLDRRDFAIGAGQSDPAALGFEVGVSVALTALRD